MRLFTDKLDLERLDWVKAMNVFLRLLAALTLLRGLSCWATIIGFYQIDFLSSSTALQTYLIFCAIVSLIAAIGLWMLNKWGAALWLFVIIVALVIDIMGMISNDMSVDLIRPFYRMVFDFILLIAYFGFTAQSVIWSGRHIKV
jgi:hypothetical protein